MKHIESVFYVRLSLKHNSRTKRFSRLSSAGYAPGKNKILQDFWVIIKFLPIVFFFWLILSYYFGVTSHFEFLFCLLKFAKLVFDGVESNPGPNINGIGIYKNSKYEMIGFLRIIFCNTLFSSEKSFCLRKNWYKLCTTTPEW